MLRAQTETEKGTIDSIRNKIILDTVLISKKIIELEANKFTFHKARKKSRSTMIG